MTGIFPQDEEGSFVWQRTGKPLNFSAWTTNQPDGAAVENCVAMDDSHTYFWTDEQCEDLRCAGVLLKKKISRILLRIPVVIIPR